MAGPPSFQTQDSVSKQIKTISISSNKSSLLSQFGNVIGYFLKTALDILQLTWIPQFIRPLTNDTSSHLKLRRTCRRTNFKKIICWWEVLKLFQSVPVSGRSWASNWYLEGCGFDSCWGLRKFFLWVFQLENASDFILFLYHRVNEHGFCGLKILLVFGYITQQTFLTYCTCRC